MLALARAKVPAAEFQEARLEALPLGDASVDVVTCALALEHVDDLGAVILEFGRVLRPGGWLVCSDTHPIMRELGIGAFVPRNSERLELVRGHVHHVHDYLDAFTGAGLALGRCIEPPLTDAVAASFPSHPLFPDATAAAWVGLPHLLIWQVVKS
jgi:SAM-dependent methyltransferase